MFATPYKQYSHRIKSLSSQVVAEASFMPLTDGEFPLAGFCLCRNQDLYPLSPSKYLQISQSACQFSGSGIPSAIANKQKLDELRLDMSKANLCFLFNLPVYSFQGSFAGHHLPLAARLTRADVDRAGECLTVHGMTT